MPNPIRLPIPEPGTDLLRFFAKHRAELNAALDTSVAEFDELAQIIALEFTAVATGAGGVEVRYALSWHAIHACSDQQAQGTSDRVLRGRVDGANWVFEHRLPPPVRDTIDEF